MTEFYDLAIRWNNRKTATRKIIEAGCVPVYGRPQFFERGKWVAIVTKGNVIQLMFKAASIEGPSKLKLLSGKTRDNSYLIHIAKKTIRQFNPGMPSPIQFWPAIGAFQYFDQVTMEQVIVGEYHHLPNDRFKPYRGGIPNFPHGHPEAKLVKQYVEWTGDNARFRHDYIGKFGLYTDLFDITHWQLVEAKADIDRKLLRMAIGQLYDYKRYYNRPPSLAVLLPSQPLADCLKLLTDNRISVIWKNPGRSFSIRRWDD
jgi:hypothetical protein